MKQGKGLSLITNHKLRCKNTKNTIFVVFSNDGELKVICTTCYMKGHSLECSLEEC